MVTIVKCSGRDLMILSNGNTLDIFGQASKNTDTFRFYIMTN